MRSSSPTEVRSFLVSAAGRGLVAGLVGAAAMTAGEKVEQAVTHRPNSYLPARTLLALLGQHPGDRDRPTAWNHLMHYGTAASVGALRGVWAAVGLRGGRANVAHTIVRLTFDRPWKMSPEWVRHPAPGRSTSKRSTSSTKPCTRSPPGCWRIGWSRHNWSRAAAPPATEKHVQKKARHFPAVHSRRHRHQQHRHPYPDINIPQTNPPVQVIHPPG